MCPGGTTSSATNISPGSTAVVMACDGAALRRSAVSAHSPTRRDQSILPIPNLRGALLQRKATAYYVDMATRTEPQSQRKESREQPTNSANDDDRVFFADVPFPHVHQRRTGGGEGEERGGAPSSALTAVIRRSTSAAAFNAGHPNVLR